jgi:hypothetical protein
MTTASEKASHRRTRTPLLFAQKTTSKRTRRCCFAWVVEIIYSKFSLTQNWNPSLTGSPWSITSRCISEPVLVDGVLHDPKRLGRDQLYRHVTCKANGRQRSKRHAFRSCGGSCSRGAQGHVSRGSRMSLTTLIIKLLGLAFQVETAKKSKAIRV